MPEQDIAKIDKNHAAHCETLAGCDIYSVDSPGFEFRGLPFRKPGGPFGRFAPEANLDFNQGVKSLASCTTGAALRFRTNSTEIKLHAVISDCRRMCHMTLVGSMGFDLYVGNGRTQVFAQCTKFNYKDNEYTCLMYAAHNAEMRDFTIYFPLYSGVQQVDIGLTKGAKVEAPTPWSDNRPIIVYGTSVTQGGCVSRPGMLYTNILSRILNRPFYNYGFSGSGKGEPEVAALLTEIPEEPAMYILDYDSNAQPDRLEKTLEPFIAILRKKYPKVPILAISTQPKSMEGYNPFAPADALSVAANYVEHRRRYTEIHKTVNEKLRFEGDDNLYFVDGASLYGADFDECTVDGAHFTDLGAYRYAHSLAPVIERILARWW